MKSLFALSALFEERFKMPPPKPTKPGIGRRVLGLTKARNNFLLRYGGAAAAGALAQNQAEKQYNNLKDYTGKRVEGIGKNLQDPVKLKQRNQQKTAKTGALVGGIGLSGAAAAGLGALAIKRIQDKRRNNRDTEKDDINEKLTQSENDTY